MDRLAVISAASQRFADVLAVFDPETPCPTCPDWSAADLLWHLTNVHLFWAGILERRLLDESDLPEVEQSKPPRPESIPDLLALREHATAGLITQLAQRDDDEPCWSWWPADQTVGFTRRMQTYEATMHRVDAELTAGRPVGEIAVDVAAGAVDHAVDVVWGWMPDGAQQNQVRTVEFVADDTGQRWLVDRGSWTAAGSDGAVVEGPRATRSSTGTPSATVTAPVVDLALWAWRRGGEVHISGDGPSVAALAAVVDEGMQ